MNVYDFDKTIFPTDSTALFTKWCFKKQPSLIKYLPGMAWAGLKLVTKAEEKSKCKEKIYRFFSSLSDAEALAEEFWREHFDRMQPWYLAQQREDDVIISASPEFLLKPACRRLGVHLIATLVDPKTGRYLSPNCSEGQKPIRFAAEFGSDRVEGFWSDSLGDTPMAMVAEKSFLVKGAELSPWPGKEDK